ncbi:MAG: outer membrane lipoprotein carrier protein LolA [Nannocystaceae bacterium]
MADPAAQEAALDALLGRFAAMQGLSARFREEKSIALLAAPLINEGVIHFAAPGKLVRHTKSPVRSTVLLDGERLTFGDERGVEAISFAQNPVVGLFVASFVKIFAGDKAALKAMYKMSFEPGPTADAWSLRLRPQVAPMDKIVERIEITGDGVVIRSMKVVEVGGDETLTVFTEVDTDRRFTAAELAELFRVGR